MSYEMRRALLVEFREHMHLGRREMARLLNLGSPKGYENYTKKEWPEGKGGRRVNMPELLAAQLLAFVYDQGFDVEAIEFDDDGRIALIPRR